MKKYLCIPAIALLLISFQASAQKFAYVNTDYILDNIPAYQDAQKHLDNLSVSWQKEIEGKYTEIDKMYKSYQAEQILLTEDMKKKREQEIVNKEKEVKDLQKQRFGQGGDLFKKRQELVKPIQDKIYNAVKKIATEGNYAFIFDKTSESVTMLFTNPKYDKSDDILNAMGFKPGPKPSTSGGGSGGGTKGGDSKSPGKTPAGGDGGTKPNETKSPTPSAPTQDGKPTEMKNPK